METEPYAEGEAAAQTRTCRRKAVYMAKALATKATLARVHAGEGWSVYYGELKRGRGRPSTIKPLFKAVGEKIPFAALGAVQKDMRSRGIVPTGIYLAHDSMGVVRYVGRGNIFPRLRARKRAQQLELVYFSFYVGLDKTHEREIETVLIRAVGQSAYFNTRKKREDIMPGNVRDYEAGTAFYERQYTRGRRPAKSRAKR